ncbi:uncharacterized protein LOC124392587 isoform X2 [Silurus meridionalis]|uniref:Ig-like domain-containing protein n=1 Tax=Silurus meridionalis TaxID=175797 RepID=A0A8T0B7J8_SILME|nr:uncharacterized protein LOC124392587 isoform X2 [Silurus meridionalis]KAF7702539.1 hypothetical protein HF521_001822 [Silurus meridionalis]
MCRCVFFPMLVFSIIIISVSPTPAVTQIVSAGENITLHCNISPSTEMVWYKHHHHELTMIISVQKGSLEGDLAVNHNQDPEHFLFSQNNSGYARSETMSLIIKGIRQSDIGFYYCGARQEGSHMKFGRAISLQFPDAVKYTSGSAACWTPLVSVCSALALMLTLCLGIIFKRGLISPCCMKCGKDDGMKEADLQYASLRHNATPQERKEPPTNHTVTYDIIARKVTKHPQV